MTLRALVLRQMTGGDGRPDDDPERLRAAEVVALRLGELIEEVYEEVRTLPRWRPAPTRRAAIERSLFVGLTFFHAWREAFVDPAA